MSNNTSTHHLNQDELIRAAVDTSDLPEERQNHLSGCHECSQKLKRLSQQLNGLGQTALRMAPTPKRPFRLPTTQQSSKRLLLPAWGVGMAAAILVAAVVLKPQWPWSPSLQGPGVNAAADRKLMVEVNALVDNALPETFQQLAVLSSPATTDTPDTEGDFMDWIAPDIDTDDDDEFIL